MLVLRDKMRHQGWVDIQKVEDLDQEKKDTCLKKIEAQEKKEDPTQPEEELERDEDDEQEESEKPKKGEPVNTLEIEEKLGRFQFDDEYDPELE